MFGSLDMFGPLYTLCVVHRNKSTLFKLEIVKGD